MIKYSGSGLAVLLEGKKITEEQQRKIIITQEALGLISKAIATENSGHKLLEEMDNLGSYISKIEAALE